VAFEDFDAARRERDLEPVAFQLGGERFECVPVMPAQVMFDFLAGGSSTVERFQTAVAFIVGVLVEPDGEERFRKVLDTRDDPIDYDTLSALVAWLVSTYTGRPTTRPSASPSGLSDTGRSSKPKSRKGSGR